MATNHWVTGVLKGIAAAAALTYATTAMGAGYTLKTTIHRVVGDATATCGITTTTTDQTIEWASNPIGNQTKKIIYNICFATAYNVFTSNSEATYDASGTSNQINSGTGGNAAPPSTLNPAPAPFNIDWLNWNLTDSNGSSTNQTTTVEMRPIAGGTETATDYALFVLSVSAVSANGTAIPSSQISIDGVTADSNGRVFKSYTLDGALKNITPTVSGYQNYSFTIGVQVTKLVITYAGNSNPTPPVPVWVSDKIDVSMALEPAIASVSIDAGSYRWFVDGSKISKFNHVSNNGGPVYWVDPKTSSTAFAWVTGGNQSVTAWANVKGQFLNSKRTFSVTRPTVSPSAVFPCPGPIVFYPWAGLLACNGATPLPVGFYASTTLGQPVIWVQIVGSASATSAVYPTSSVTKSTAGLDKTFPGSSDPFYDDSPAHPLQPQNMPTMNFVNRSDSFSLFLMLARSGSDYAVPIGRVDWGWNVITQKLGPGAWALSGGGESITLAQPSSTFPTWSKTAQGSDLLP